MGITVKKKKLIWPILALLCWEGRVIDQHVSIGLYGKDEELIVLLDPWVPLAPENLWAG